jgi:predicted nucleic acid-binding protein
MIVLDTNVVSELMRATPAPAVLTWLQQTSSTGLYTTSVTVAEIRYGIARLPDGRRKHDLQQAANEIFAAFPRQVLPFDLAAATAYADVVAGRERDGNSISGFDGQIAAICRSQAATLATRNTKDFIDTGISLIDPWQETTRAAPPS